MISGYESHTGHLDRHREPDSERRQISGFRLNLNHDGLQPPSPSQCPMTALATVAYQLHVVLLAIVQRRATDGLHWPSGCIELDAAARGCSRWGSGRR